jgi:hydrogenase expression/formation protein HypE
MSSTADGVGPRLGKLAPDVLARVVTPWLGAARGEVLVGPKPGCDAAIVRIGAGRVMAMTTDPLSLVPALGPARSAKLSCHLLASDLWTTGIPPAYASVSFALPPGLDDAVFETYWRAMSDAWAALGVAVVTGHTGRYDGCDLSIVGAATLVGVGDEGRWLSPAMAQPGDRVVITKGCAIETAAVAAHLFPERLAARLEPEALERARALIDRVSVVDDCRAAVSVGVRERGVTALHDATEGGVLGGLVELAQACGGDVRAARERFPRIAEVDAVCEVFGIADAGWALSTGTLIATVRPHAVAALLDALRGAGLDAADVGEVMKGGGRLWLTEPGGEVRRIDAPEADPYWPAYERAVREGWR